MAGYCFRQPCCHFCGSLIERPEEGVVCWEESIESDGKWRAQSFAVAHHRCVPPARPFQCDPLTQVSPGYLTGLALRFTRRMYEQVDVPALVWLICELFPFDFNQLGRANNCGCTPSEKSPTNATCEGWTKCREWERPAHRKSPSPSANPPPAECLQAPSQRSKRSR